MRPFAVCSQRTCSSSPDRIVSPGSWPMQMPQWFIENPSLCPSVAFPTPMVPAMRSASERTVAIPHRQVAPAQDGVAPDKRG